MARLKSVLMAAHPVKNSGCPRGVRCLPGGTLTPGLATKFRARMTSTSRLPLLSTRLSWMSPMRGEPSACRPTSWEGPSPSRKSLNWPSPPKRKLVGSHNLQGEMGDSVKKDSFMRISTWVLYLIQVSKHIQAFPRENLLSNVSLQMKNWMKNKECFLLNTTVKFPINYHESNCLCPIVYGFMSSTNYWSLKELVVEEVRGGGGDSTSTQTVELSRISWGRDSGTPPVLK